MSSQPEVHLHQLQQFTGNTTINNIAGDSYINVYNQALDVRHENRRWLDAPDPSSNHKAACSKRQSTTGNWFIGGVGYAEWKTNPCQVLCLHGRPGCGKTILSSTIVQDVMAHCNANLSSFALAYFYFDFQSREKQTCQSLLRSLITQFLDHGAATAGALDQFHHQLYCDIQSTRQKSDLDDLLKLLKRILSLFQHLFIVIDALDECRERDRLLKLIEDILEWKLDTLHLLLTSRKEREIEDSLTPRVSREVDIQEAVISKDIELYVRARLQHDRKLKKWPEKAREEIKEALTQGAHGMFRWVACQLDELQKCAKHSELRKSLKSLPETLDETYERILLSIDKLYKDDVYRVLQWLCFSRRPVTLEEMVEALAVTLENGAKFDPEERYVDPRDILTRCSSLVSISARGTGDELRLAHFSVKEYLISDRIRNGRVHMYAVVEDHAHILMSEICLAYLLQFETLVCPDDSMIRAHPLSMYAAVYWMEHARFGEGERSARLLTIMIELFKTCRSQSHTFPFITWVRLHNIDNPNSRRTFDLHPSAIPGPLYYAVLAVGLSDGYEELVELMLKHGADVDAQGGSYSTALGLASSRGHEGIVKLLLLHGADVNAQTGVHVSALRLASLRGHEGIVKLLLQNGADVSARVELYDGALEAASSRGHEAIVKLLFEHGVDVRAQGREYGRALRAASSGGYEGIVKLLLQHDADAKAHPREYGRAIHAAISEGHEAIIELLLQHGADVNASGSVRGSALEVASSAGHEGIVKLLLQYGADVNAPGGVFGSALHAAWIGGHSAVVELLLQHGADVNASGIVELEFIDGYPVWWSRGYIYISSS